MGCLNAAGQILTLLAGMKPCATRQGSDTGAKRGRSNTCV
jgi:hypothetical protein